MLNKQISCRKNRFRKIVVDSFNIAQNRNYYFRFWRYRSQKPLIVTTNLTLDEIRYPQDTAHARIYDRLLEMCVPVSCIGVSFRKETAQEKMERLKSLIGWIKKHFQKNPQDVLSSATRKWSCLLNNFHRIENNPTPSECSTPTFDEWSAFATFLADVIEKYASVLEIDNAVSSINNENLQDAVDTTIAAWYNFLVIFVPTQWQGLPFHCITYTERGAQNESTRQHS